MSQSTFDDDELFGEAASEMRAEVEAALEDAYEELPASDDIWDVESDNTLGVLNALKTALDAGDAAEHLREAKKNFVVGDRAGAFDDADDLREAIEELESAIEDITAAREQASDLAATVPGLRSALGEFEDADEDDD